MRRGSLVLAALFLAAPALAQDLPLHKQDSTPSPANLDGLAPKEIICMETRSDGRPEEISRTKWEGGAVPADACPPGSDPFQAYTLQAMTNIGRPLAPSHSEAGGTDHP